MESTGITGYFGKNLAGMLSRKIIIAHESFDQTGFVRSVAKGINGKTLTQRVEWIADNLQAYLPSHYPEAVSVLLKILGPENEKETGMFTHFYWLMPVGKFVEKCGLGHFKESLMAIEEITKRNTGEYAIRPFVRKYPARTLKQMKKWALSENFHVRRLASEGLRPKLPWASKLDLFVAEPQPVFDILELLKADSVKFVKKSVANHLTDYIKLNPREAGRLISQWKRSGDENTQWILRHATRKIAGL